MEVAEVVAGARARFAAVDRRHQCAVLQLEMGVAMAVVPDRIPHERFHHPDLEAVREPIVVEVSDGIGRWTCESQ